MYKSTFCSLNIGKKNTKIQWLFKIVRAMENSPWLDKMKAQFKFVKFEIV